MSSRKNVYKLVLAGMFLALALVLPLLTGQIPQIGKMLSPMHIPVLLCGFFCSPWYGLVVGFIAPLLRGLIFGMPVLFPSGVIMAFELATYGCVSGLLYKLLPKKIVYIYVTLIAAMLAGRVVWGVVSAIVYGITKAEFGWQAFMAGAFINAVPGIILHIVLIPVIVIALRKYTAKD
ncbi:MAG: ECF transporter S component [Lachnospiraceae bacterium]|nr:ECF transporter S component [Lachnospiraceae bacterium]